MVHVKVVKCLFLLKCKSYTEMIYLLLQVLKTALCKNKSKCEILYERKHLSCDLVADCAVKGDKNPLKSTASMSSLEDLERTEFLVSTNLHII